MRSYEKLWVTSLYMIRARNLCEQEKIKRLKVQLSFEINLTLIYTFIKIDQLTFTFFYISCKVVTNL